MKRSGPIPRKTPIRKRNHKRARKAYDEAYGGSYATWIRSLPCEACRKAGWRQVWRTVAAHAARTRGAGGKAPDQVPLCGPHETEWHSRGRQTFDKRYGTDLKALAVRLWDEYQGGSL